MGRAGSERLYEGGLDSTAGTATGSYVDFVPSFTCARSISFAISAREYADENPRSAVKLGRFVLFGKTEYEIFHRTLRIFEARP